MNNEIYNNELYHHGIKGMKWGVRRYQKKDGTLTPAGEKRYNSGDTGSKSPAMKKVGKVVSKGLEKSREKAERRKKSYEKTTDVFGIGGSAVRSYYEYQGKKAVKGTLAKVVNSAANAYITNNSSNYAVARGVDFARRATVRGLSLSSQIDQVQAYANVARSAMYAYNK